MTRPSRSSRVPVTGADAASGAGAKAAGNAAATDLTQKSPPANPLASSATPQLPHERDQVAGATDGVPSEKVRQGYRDLTRGIRDTSRAPEVGAAYDKLKK